MIELRNVSKQLGRGATSKIVFRDVSVTLPSDRRVAVLGLPGGGKTTLISLLAGVERPNAGSIHRNARLSFPVGFGRSLKTSLSMRQNAKFAARVYGCDAVEVASFVEKLLGMESIFDSTMRKLPASQRAPYLYALAYAIPFDTYLVDGNLAGPPGPYRDKVLALVEARTASAGLILATRNVRLARQVCDVGAVITGKTIVLYEDIEEAIAAFEDDLDRYTVEKEMASETIHEEQEQAAS